MVSHVMGKMSVPVAPLPPWRTILPLWISPETLPTEPEVGIMESTGGNGGSAEEDGNEEVTLSILCRSTR